MSMPATASLPTTLPDWLVHCERLHPNTIEMGLERVRTVAQRVDSGRGIRPGCPVIVVAGTNGKGSTCAMLEAIYSQAGYRTGVYTSPHLVHFEERCRIQGQSAEAQQLVAAFADIEHARLGDGTAAQPEVALTYFEFTTLAIVLAMQRARLDVMILEVGLGGRLDAVNVFDADCAVITSIDIDHVNTLAPTARP